jgi:hypothetical protein
MGTRPVNVGREVVDDEAFLRTIIFPEEDRHVFTTAPWNGGYRWFRAPNVVCLEQYRRLLRAG